MGVSADKKRIIPKEIIYRKREQQKNCLSYHNTKDDWIKSNLNIRQRLVSDLVKSAVDFGKYFVEITWTP